MAVVFSIVWAFRRLKKPSRASNMSARGYALYSMCPQLSFFPYDIQAARCMQTLANKSRGNLTQPHLGDLLSVLVTGLAGRTWNGKDTLLQAISSVCVTCRSVITDSANNLDIDTVLTSVYRECKKENLTYKMAALRCYSAVVNDYDMNKFTDVYTIVQPIIDKVRSIIHYSTANHQ